MDAETQDEKERDEKLCNFSLERIVLSQDPWGIMKEMTYYLQAVKSQMEEKYSYHKYQKDLKDLW